MLADFFTGLKEAILARGFTGPVQIFAKNIAHQDSAVTGRVVCKLSRDTVTAPRLVGANPRAVAQRSGALEIHVWGPTTYVGTGKAVDDFQSLKNTETLLQTVINAIKDNAVGTSVIDSVDWQQSEATPIMRAGFVAVLSMTVEVPVVDVTYPVSPPGASGPVLPGSGTVVLLGPSGGMTGP